MKCYWVTCAGAAVELQDLTHPDTDSQDIYLSEQMEIRLWFLQNWQNQGLY